MTAAPAPRDARLDLLCQHLLNDTPGHPAVARPLALARQLLPGRTLSLQAEPAPDGTHAILTGPGGHVIGTLRADGPPLSAPERALLDALAQALTDSVTRDVLTGQLSQALQFTASMADIHALTADAATPEETAAAAVAILHRRMRVDWSGLLRLQNGELQVLTDHAAAQGAHLGAVLRGHLTLDPAFTAPWVTRAHNFQDDYAQANGAVPSLLTAGVRSAAWLALGDPDGQGPFVLLLTRQDEPAVWTEQERQLLIAAARSVDIALERAATMQHLERQARTDALTGLGNRRALDEQLHALEGETFTLGVIDLNGMKRVNDERGHASGDDLLRTFARELQRGPALAFRLGGDEYALIDLPGTDPGEAGPDGDGHSRLRDLTEQAVAATQARGFPVTAALGTACVPADTRSPTHALRIADTRMYQHKHADDR